mgnify:CR=1 FL=1
MSVRGPIPSLHDGHTLGVYYLPTKAITKRVLSELKKKHTKDPEAYGQFWAQFGKVLKEGLYEDAENREKIAEIILVRSMKHEKMISLQSYLDTMAEGQDSIYVLSADSLKQAMCSRWCARSLSSMMPSSEPSCGLRQNIFRCAMALLRRSR